MKRAAQWIAAICILTLAAHFSVIVSHLPPDNRGLVSEKYSGWSGVLRVWIYEGWTRSAGSLAGWLNQCGASFEKKHSGVYVQIKYVDENILPSMDDSGLIPPDVILFPPGLLDNADGLLLLPDMPVRTPFRRSSFCVPVAAGGYCWAVSRDSESSTAGIAPDGAWNSRSAALLSMGGYASAKPSELPELPGIDLGLPALSTEPGAILRDHTSLKQFIRGELKAVLVTQDELRYMEQRAQTQSVPDFEITIGTAGFTDQLLLAAALKSDSEREALSKEFILHLLGEACQQQLCEAGYLGVTDLPCSCPPADPLSLLDAALRRESTVIAPFFRKNWRTECEVLANSAENTNNIPFLPKALFEFSA